MRIRPSRCALAALLLILTGSAVRADDEVENIQILGERLRLERDLDDREALEELRRTPGGVALVDAASIEQRRAFGLEDVLGRVPGVMARSRGLGEEPQISIRGSGLRSNFHTRGVNVLIDGFPFQNADGFSDVESFEFLAARRVEVYKGANSLRYGGDALGGAINLVTHTGRNAAPLRARVEGGGYGFIRSYASGAHSAGPWDAFLALSHTQQDGYRDHAEQDRQRFYGSLGRKFEGGAALRLDLNAVRNRVDLPGALTREEFRRDPSQANPESELQDEARDYEFGRAALALSIPVSEEGTLEWLNQYSSQDLWHPLAFGIIDSRTTNASSELRLSGEHAWLGQAGRFGVGLQAAWTRQPQEIHANSGGSQGPTFADQVGKASNLGLYAVEELELGPAWSLVAGTRAQHARRQVDDRLADDEDSESYFWWSPSLGAIWRLAPERQVYANVGRVQEVPVLFELTAPGNLGGDLSDLEVQRAWQFELGTRGELGDRLGWDVSVYDMELRDEIRNLNVIPPFPCGGCTIPRYENIDRSRHWGVDASGELRVTPELVWSTSYTFSRFVYVDDPVFDSNDLPGAPRHFLRSELRWSHASGLWIAPAVEVTPTSYYVDSANTVKTSGYALLHLRLGYEHESSGISGFVELRNLADREHVSSVVVDVDPSVARYFEPGDGRALYLGIDWRFR
jgi:iron complex outermembrane receptor protein